MGFSPFSFSFDAACAAPANPRWTLELRFCSGGYFRLQSGFELSGVNQTDYLPETPLVRAGKKRVIDYQKFIRPD
jgi:hypothetical protein